MISSAQSFPHGRLLHSFPPQQSSDPGPRPPSLSAATAWECSSFCPVPHPKEMLARRCPWPGCARQEGLQDTSSWHWGMQVPSLPLLRLIQPWVSPPGRPWLQELPEKRLELEGVKTPSLLRDFSLICAHVPGIRAVGGSASLWQSFRPTAQHLTGSANPLSPALFKFN